MRSVLYLCATAGLALVAGCGSSAVLPSAAPVDAPDPMPPGAAELRRDLLVLASDSLRGREAGTPDERRAAQFIAARAAAIGLTPAGDSGFVQRIPVLRTALGDGSRFTIRTARGEAHLVSGLRPLMELGPDFPPLRRHVDGPLVFAGYGLRRPDHADDLARVPVAGHVVVVVNGAPSSADAGTRAELESPAAIAVRLQRILPLHPAAVIFVLTGPSADLYEAAARTLARGTLSIVGGSDTVLAAAAGRGDVEVRLRPDSVEQGPMILFALPTHASALLPARWPRDDRPQVLHGARLLGTVDVTRSIVQSYNVVAAIPGRDSARRTAWVALGAHYDHLGIQPPVHGDSVAHGADDDGTGCAALLAVARTMMQRPRPARSVLFIWHTGEEKGLLGSTYFASHPTVPIDSITAFVDADMVGRNAPDSLYVVGPGVAPAGRSVPLGALVDSVNAALPAPFAFNRALDVPGDPLRIYYRADTYPYGEHGVPVVLFTSGAHADYHQVTDVPARVDYTKLARVARLLFAVADALANRGVQPVPR